MKRRMEATEIMTPGLLEMAHYPGEVAKHAIDSAMGMLLHAAAKDGIDLAKDKIWVRITAYAEVEA